MKHIIGLFWMPFLLLAAIIAVLRTIFTITILFAWQQSGEWEDKIILKMRDFVKKY